MTFLVQFLRFRRGVPEAIRTLPIAADNPSSALAQAKGLVGSGSYPIRTEALRVMDDGGRTLMEWLVPVLAEQPTPRPIPTPLLNEPHAVSLRASVERIPEERETSLTIQHHHFVAGQPISYAEDGNPAAPKGGFEIVGLGHPGTNEPSYVIRSADESSDRLVKEHELQEDLGARVRGR